MLTHACTHARPHTLGRSHAETLTKQNLSCTHAHTRKHWLYEIQSLIAQPFERHMHEERQRDGDAQKEAERKSEMQQTRRSRVPMVQKLFKHVEDRKPGRASDICAMFAISKPPRKMSTITLSTSRCPRPEGSSAGCRKIDRSMSVGWHTDLGICAGDSQCTKEISLPLFSWDQRRLRIRTLRASRSIL